MDTRLRPADFPVLPVVELHFAVGINYAVCSYRVSGVKGGLALHSVTYNKLVAICLTQCLLKV